MTSDKLDPDVLKKLLSEQVDASITKMLSDKIAREAADSLKKLSSTTVQTNPSDISEKLRSLTEMLEKATARRGKGMVLTSSTPHGRGVRDKGFASWAEPFDGYKTKLIGPTSEYGAWVDEADYLPEFAKELEPEPEPKQKVNQDKPQTEFDIVW